MSYEADKNVQKIRKLWGEIPTTEQGYIHMDTSVWRDLSSDEKKLIQKYNARVKHNENYNEVKYPENVIIKHKVRRTHEDNRPEDSETPTKQEPQSKKIKREGKGKGIRFNLGN